MSISTGHQYEVRFQNEVFKITFANKCPKKSQHGSRIFKRLFELLKQKILRVSVKPEIRRYYVYP